MTTTDTITLASLLEEMTDLVALTRMSVPGYRIAHCSSYDRASVSPDDPEGWFANIDRGPFFRKEHNQGREEYVIAEFDGPGCLNRLWAPDRRIPPKAENRGQETANVRIYLDDNQKPVIEGLFQDVFNGEGPFPSPFAHRSLSSAVSYFPVPFASKLKITLDSEPFYYNVSARIYAPGTKVESFTIDDLRTLSDRIAATGERLLHPPTAANGSVVSDVVIAPGNSEGVTLPDGPRAVTSIIVTADVQNADTMRGLILQMTADGEETIYCPVGEFFGYIRISQVVRTARRL